MTLLAAVLLIPTALAVRAAAGRWLRPGPLFAGYWAIAGIAPVLLLETPRVGVRAVVYIAVAVALFTLGALSTTGPLAATVQAAAMPELRRTPLLWGVAGGSAAGILAGLLALRDHGMAVGSVLSADGLLDTGSTIAAQRYAGQALSPAVAGLLALTYAAALVAPFARIHAGARWWWLIAPTAAAGVFSAITTAKAALVIAGACTIGGYIAAWTLRAGDAPKVSRRGLAAAAAAVAVLGALSAGMMFIRLGQVDARTASIVQGKMAVYALGYEPGFSEWIDRYETTDAAPLRWGAETLTGSAYPDFAAINEEGDRTNVYTMFRGLVMDFGTAGAAAVVYALGLLAGLAFRRTTTRSLGWAMVLGCVYAVVLFSSVTSIVSFTNVSVAMAVALGAVLWSARPGVVPVLYPARISR